MAHKTHCASWAYFARKPKPLHLAAMWAEPHFAAVDARVGDDGITIAARADEEGGESQHTRTHGRARRNIGASPSLRGRVPAASLPDPWPPALVELRASVADRPGCQWVAGIYRRHRGSSAEIAPLAGRGR